MSLDQEVEKIMNTIDKHEQSVKLAELSFKLEMDASIDEKDMIDVIELIIEFIIKEKNSMSKTTFLMLSMT